jgi:hypothetical protein
MVQKRPPAFQPLTGIYEPSAIQQLPDGRFLVVEDEKRHPFSLVAIGADGSVDSTEFTAGLFQIFSDFWKLDDLEGLALDRAGFGMVGKAAQRAVSRFQVFRAWSAQKG